MTTTIPIEVGGTYEFHSTAMANKDVTPFSGQTVTVVAPMVTDDPDSEPMFTVRFPDGHGAGVFVGEINGWYLASGQCVEGWRSDPVLAAQMDRDAEAWA